jgi:hypothetical protein
MEAVLHTLVGNLLLVTSLVILMNTNARIQRKGKERGEMLLLATALLTGAILNIAHGIRLFLI